jgi:hypothetical protein
MAAFEIFNCKEIKYFPQPLDFTKSVTGGSENLTNSDHSLVGCDDHAKRYTPLYEALLCISW